MPSSKTSEKLKGSAVRHFSVFLENKVGALLEMVKLVNEHNVEVLTLSILDFSESAIARMLVSDPNRIQELFRTHNIPHSTCEILLIELPQSSENLSQVLSCLLMAEINVSFAYPLLIRPRGKAVLALHSEDLECASSVLMSQGFQLLNQADLSR